MTADARLAKANVRIDRDPGKKFFSRHDESYRIGFYALKKESETEYMRPVQAAVSARSPGTARLIDLLSLSGDLGGRLYPVAPMARGRRSASHTARPRFFQRVQALSQRAASRSTEVVSSLKVQPELRTRPEASRKEKSRLRRNAPLAANDLVHALEGNTELTGKLELRSSQRSQELFQKDLTRMCRYPIAGQHAASVSVVIRYADRTGVSIFPSKNDSPLVIYSNAAESFERTFQVFETVTRRNPKILCRLGGVQHVKLSDCGAHDIRRKPPCPCGTAAVVKILRSGISEREDHRHHINAFTASMQKREAGDRGTGQRGDAGTLGRYNFPSTTRTAFSPRSMRLARLTPRFLARSSERERSSRSTLTEITFAPFPRFGRPGFRRARCHRLRAEALIGLNSSTTIS